jgi:hypothetical protein
MRLGLDTAMAWQAKTAFCAWSGQKIAIPAKANLINGQPLIAAFSLWLRDDEASSSSATKTPYASICK